MQFLFCKHTNLTRGLLYLLLVGLAVISFSNEAKAQAGFNHYYVDPVNGSNANTGLTLNSPLYTIGFAVQLAIPPAIVHCKPGIYDKENFPISMRKNVHVISVRGAKETIVRAPAGTPPMNNVFLPITNMAPLLRSQQQAVVLVDYSNVPLDQTDNLSNPVFQGFTTQGGDIHFYAYSESGQAEGCICNNVIDMRYYEIFGILIVNRYTPTGYKQMEFSIIHNTIIHCWEDGPNGNEPTGVNNIGICNVNDPRNLDPNPLLRGVGALLIHNNCIRSLPTDLRTSMMGIDDSDTRTLNGQWSNAFPTGTANNNSGQYSSQIVGAAPQAKVWLTNSPGAGLDMACVGEMVNGRFGVLHPTQWVRDFRILPKSPLVDQGIVPNANGQIVNANGVIYYEYSYPPQTDYWNTPGLNPNWQIGAFLWDGEGYGNPRIVDNPVMLGNSADIGFDETNDLCVAGSYGNDSRSHNQSCQAGVIPNGDVNRHMIFPDQGRFWLYVQSGNIGLGWNWIPGTWPVSLTNNGLNWLYLVQPGIGNYYIDPIYWFLAIGAATVFPDGWVNPTDGKPYTFGHALITTAAVDPLPCQVLNQQVIYEDPALNLSLSNLQSEYY